jgi:hypothetical protein
MKFKVGDRVRVYGAVAPKDGGSVKYAEGEKGRIVFIEPNGSMELFMDLSFTDVYLLNPNSLNEIHPRQCRLLKPKAKPKSVWISPEYLNTPDDCADSDCTSVHNIISKSATSVWVEFVEKRKGKK